MLKLAATTLDKGRLKNGNLFRKVEVENFRGLGTYSIEGFSNWTSITGPNSTNKSTLLAALSLLGSNRMHKVSDIPTHFSPEMVAPEDIPVRVKYRFRLTTSFLDLMSDDRLRGSVILSHERFLTQLNHDQDQKNKLEMELQILKSKPLRDILVDSLYSTIKELRAKYPSNRSLCEAFLYGNTEIVNKIQDVLDQVKYFDIELELRISDGPNYDFSLLNGNNQVIVSDELFFDWFKNTKSIDGMFFAFAIGSIFMKCITNPSFHKEESSLPPSSLEGEGSNLEEFIKYCLLYCPDRMETVNENFRKIFLRKIEIKKPEVGLHNEETKIVARLDNSSYWFPLEKLSDGMLRCLRVLVQAASCRRGDILAIDEPELHLHPGALKTLREILFSRKEEIQIISVTHSPLFIDPSYIDNIILHKIDGAIQVLQSSDVDLALKELGSSGLDAILFDVVIWYEGPADKEYIGRWIKLFSNEIKIPLSDIGLIHFGGKGNLEYIEPQNIKKIARKSIFVIDSDKKDKDAKFEQLITSFVEKCNQVGIKCWITQRKEIENYIPTKVLVETLRISDTAFEIKPYDDVFEKIKSRGRSISKTSLSKSISEKLVKEDILNDTEFYAELKNSLIDFRLWDISQEPPNHNRLCHKPLHIVAV